ncbi:MAG: Plug domain-containing protein, partial [Alphaproteobacteria bacterium]|nr:Plug domain-containing protein [Alphaproteobacteria bacterium]
MFLLKCHTSANKVPSRVAELPLSKLSAVLAGGTTKLSSTHWRLFFLTTAVSVGSFSSQGEAQSSGSGVSIPAVTVTAPDTARKKQAQRSAPDQSRRRAATNRPRQPGSAPAPGGAPGGAGLAPTGAPGRGELSSAVTALPAAVTVIDAPAISRLPVTTYGDLFRSLPGFNVSNFGQGAIGYGLSLRGYTEAEHGRDIAYYIDGVPVNEISSLHTPNYADLNILLPETVKSIEIVRGPFSVEYGDSNL